MPLTTVQAGMLDTTAQYYSFKNRIINGAMVIDQRNAGASVTLSTTTQYPVDRFPAYKGTSGATVTAQRSTTAPAGFTNSIIFTASTGATPAAGDINATWQTIEGFNFADMGWGTANAQTVTLSFWVRSSVTGTYSVSFQNSAANRFYVATYTVNSANTWEQKSITVSGDTSGTWATDNSTGIQITWDLGYGSNFNGTAGSWGASTIRRTSGSVQLIATTGATFYITGVQLEKGSTATSFDYRPYGTELALCQRYLPAWQFANSSTNIANTFVYSNLNSGPFQLINPVAVRTPVTGLTVSAAGNFSVSDGDSSTACNAITFSSGSTMITGCAWGTGSNRTAYRPHYLFTNTTNASILGTGCEL
jgi:hypothetical protein